MVIEYTAHVKQVDDKYKSGGFSFEEPPPLIRARHGG